MFGIDDFLEGASIVAGFLGNEDTNDTNIQLNKENRDWQERMSNTAHQREVADLNAAGLNPMLSYRNNGASTPPTQPATVTNSAAAGVNSALAHAQVEQMQAQTKTAETQAALNAAEALKTNAETRLTTSSAATSEYELSRKQYLRDNFDEWFTAGKALDASQAESLFKQAKASNDQNTVTYLIDIARKHGFRNMDEAFADMDFRQLMQDYALQSLQFPEARSMANMWKSPFGQSIAPYVHSAASLGGSVGGVGIGIGAIRNAFKKAHPRTFAPVTINAN